MKPNQPRTWQIAVDGLVSYMQFPFPYIINVCEKTLKEKRKRCYLLFSFMGIFLFIHGVCFIYLFVFVLFFFSINVALVKRQKFINAVETPFIFFLSSR